MTEFRTRAHEVRRRLTTAPGMQRVARWLVNDPRAFSASAGERDRRVDPLRAAPFVAIHGACLLVVLVGASPTALWVCAALYLSRMLFITAFYHRYFAHRAFRASRAVTLAMAVLGCTAGQRGPLWWAAHHRIHHLTSDTPDDPHSPRYRGRWFSHALWFLTAESFAAPTDRIRDWTRFPEIRLLERIDWLPFIAVGAACAALGGWLESARPDLGTSAAQLFVWGFAVSTVLVYHATYTINSLAHGWGSRRYDTADDSRNNAMLAAITLGEGWHNNHHRYPAAARHGFRWWEIDVTWLFLRLLAAFGLIRDLKPVPAKVIAAGRTRPGWQMRRRQARLAVSDRAAPDGAGDTRTDIAVTTPGFGAAPCRDRTRR